MNHRYTETDRDRYGSDEYRTWRGSEQRDERDDDRSKGYGRWGSGEGQRRYSARDFGEGGARNYERSEYYYRDRDPWAGESGRPSFAGRDESRYGGARDYGGSRDPTRGGSGADWESGRRDFGARWEADRGPSGGWGLGHDPYRGGGSTQQPDWGQVYGQSQYGQGGQFGGRSWEGDRERTGGRGLAGRFFGRGPKGYKRSDERIKEDICERLWRSNFVDSSEVTVLVREGEVTLSGTVPERWMRYEIETIADDSMGVKDVNNNIRTQRPGEETGTEQTATTRAATAQGTSGSGTKQ